MSKLLFAVLDSYIHSSDNRPVDNKGNYVGYYSRASYRFDVITSDNLIYKEVDADFRLALLNNYKDIYDRNKIDTDILIKYHKYNPMEDNPTYSRKNPLNEDSISAKKENFNVTYDPDDKEEFHPEYADYKTEFEKAKDENRILAYMNEDGDLIIKSQKAFRIEYIHIDDYVKVVNYSKPYVKSFAAQGRLECKKEGNTWLVNKYCPRPEKKIITSDPYIKKIVNKSFDEKRQKETINKKTENLQDNPEFVLTKLVGSDRLEDIENVLDNEYVTEMPNSKTGNRLVKATKETGRKRTAKEKNEYLDRQYKSIKNEILGNSGKGPQSEGYIKIAENLEKPELVEKLQKCLEELEEFYKKMSAKIEEES